jgi:N6-adenosine-specific RNA methylase IME4
MDLIIRKDFKELIPPLTAEEYNNLSDSLVAQGCRDAITTWNGIIVDGHNRYEICQENSIPFRTTAMEFESEVHVRVWMRHNQMGRRNLSEGWMITLGRGNKADLLEIGKAKLCESGKTGGRGNTKGISNNDKPFTPHSTQKQLAKDIGISTGKLAQAEVVMEKAPDIWEKVKNDEMTVGGAYAEVKKAERIAKREAEIDAVREKIKNEPQTVSGVFGVIAIDPPWPYGREYDPESSRVANPYPEMSVDAISKIDLPADKDCVLYLWTTHAFMRDAFNLLDKWGFAYKATLVWDKEKMGMGATIRMQCEFCLIGLKGKPIIQGASERDIIREARREHSRKPLGFYGLVERMTIGRRLDYFSREEKQGWVSYGAESSKF